MRTTVSFAQMSSLIPVIILVISLIMASLVFMSKYSSDMKGMDHSTSYGKSNTYRTGPTCACIFTDGKDFTGNHVCLNIGRYARLDLKESSVNDNSEGRGSRSDKYTFAFSEGIQSFEIKCGYGVTAYEGENFSGKKLFDHVGPYVYRETRSNEITPIPKSVHVTIINSSFHEDVGHPGFFRG